MYIYIYIYIYRSVRVCIYVYIDVVAAMVCTTSHMMGPDNKTMRRNPMSSLDMTLPSLLSRVVQ